MTLALQVAVTDLTAPVLGYGASELQQDVVLEGDVLA